MMVVRECVKNHSRLPDTLVIDRREKFGFEQFGNMLTELGYILKISPTNALFNSNDFSRIVNDFVKSDVQHGESFWSMGNLKKTLSMFLYEIYDQKCHPILGKSPREIFQSKQQKLGEASSKSIAYNDKFVLLTFPIVERKIIPGRGIKIHNIFYWANDFINPSFNFQKIKVKFDPLNKDVAFAYINKSWKSLIKCSIFQPKSQKARRINKYD